MNLEKEEAKRLLDTLPETATWDDIMYEFYVKKKLSVALQAEEEGKIHSHEDVKKRILQK